MGFLCLRSLTFTGQHLLFESFFKKKSKNWNAPSPLQHLPMNVLKNHRYEMVDQPSLYSGTMPN
jgi:hypothetical protein